MAEAITTEESDMNVFSSLVWPEKQASARNGRVPRRLYVEGLEMRCLLAIDIQWLNRNDDGFDAVFAGDPEAARNVVDQAIFAWERVITDFNDSENEDNVFELEVHADSESDSCGGFATTPGIADPYNGIPDAGEVTILPCSPSGWFIDPTPLESSEFRGRIFNAFAGGAAGSSDPADANFNPAVGKPDLFSSMAHELGHLLGMAGDEDFLLEDLIDDNPPFDDTGIPDAGGPGTLWTYSGGLHVLYTDRNFNHEDGGFDDNDEPIHIAAAHPSNNVSGVFFGVRDIMNPSSTGGVRTLPSRLAAFALTDVYGYDATFPQAFGTFYSDLGADGELLIRGGSTGDTDPTNPTSPMYPAITPDLTSLSNDSFILLRDGADLLTDVFIGTPIPGTVTDFTMTSRFPFDAITSITLRPTDGFDDPDPDDALVQGDNDGDDFFALDFSNGNVIPEGGVSVDGGSGFDTLELRLFPPDITIDIDEFTITVGALGEVSYQSFERVNIFMGTGTNTVNITVGAASGSPQELWITGHTGDDTINIVYTADTLTTLNVMGFDGSDVVNIQELAAATTVNIQGGAGEDHLNLAEDIQTLVNIHGLVTFDGGDDSDTMTVHEEDTAFANDYQFDVTSSGMGRIQRDTRTFLHSNTELVLLFAGDEGDTVSVRETPSASVLYLYTRGGDDTVHIDSNGPFLANGNVNAIGAEVGVFGGDDSDSLTLEDSSDLIGNTVTVTDGTIGLGPTDTLFDPGGGFVRYAGLETLTINMGSGDDIINVEGTAEGTETFINARFGDDFITVTAPEDLGGGPPPPGEADGTVDNIKSLLWIDGHHNPQVDDTDILVVIDTTDDSADKMTLTEGTIGIASAGDPVDTFLGSTGAGIHYVNIDSLTIRMGSGGNTAIVRSTHPEAVTRLETGDGDDFVLVRDTTNTVNMVRSHLTIDGQDAHDAVEIDDAAETSASTMSVTPSQVLGDTTYFGLGGELNYLRLEELTVRSGLGGDIALVTGTNSGTSTTIQTGGSFDQAVVQSAFLLNTVRSPLILDGGSLGANALLLNSSDATPDQVTITDTQVLGDGTYFGLGGSFTYQNVTGLAVLTGTAGDSINIQSTAAATQYLVDGQGSFDTFLFDSNGAVAGGHLDAIQGTVTILGGGSPSNMLILNDADDASGDKVTVTATGQFDGEIGTAPGDSFFGPGAASGSGRVFYEGVQLISLTTSQAADSIQVTPAPALPIGTHFDIDANSPAPLAPGAGDQLRFDLTIAPSSKLTVDEFNGGVINSSAFGEVRFHNVDLIATPIGGTYDLVLNSNAAALGGNDGVPLDTEAFSGRIAPEKTLNLRLNGQTAFTGIELGINSLTVVGSTDSDNFTIQETSDGLPMLPGVAPTSHPNAALVPANVSIHFDGGPDLGSVIDQAAVYLIDGSSVSKIDALVLPLNSGHLNVAGQLTMSYVDISPVELLGAGGTLTIDATKLTGMTQMSVLNLGGDRYEVSGDGAFETTTFSGFDNFVIHKRQQVALQTGLVVNSTADGRDTNPGDGMCQTAVGNAECTLRAAIEESNAGPVHAIQFRIPDPCPNIIRPATALPAITASVVIDGYMQPGSSVNTLPIDLGTNATICVELNGALISDGSSGLVFQSSGNRMRGLSITGFGYPDMGAPGSTDTVPVGGVVLLGGNNWIEGNFIGVNPDGTTAGSNNFYGLYVTSSNNRIGGPTRAERNLISGNQGFGVILTARALPGTAGFVPVELNRIQGNLIGTDRTGTAAVANTAAGIGVRLFARNNLIGGIHTANSEVRNIISGNGGPFSPYGDPGGPYQDWPDAPFPISGGHGSGIIIENLALITPTFPVPNTIQGNYVGTTADGTGALGNKLHGISLAFTNSVTVGGAHNPLTPCDAACNLVSGNAQHGVVIGSTFPFNTVVQGNFIGTDRSGQLPIGNGSDGVFLFITSGNQIGGGTPAEGNIIAYNRSGVVVKGNPDVPNPGGNTIRLNSIHSNRLLGIDLLRPGTGAESDGPTMNDSVDPDTGPNQLQNFPIIASAQFGSQTAVAGTLNSLARTQFLLDFYTSTTGDASGYGEGQHWLGSITVLTNAAGNASFSQLLPGGSVPGEWITATATRLTSSGVRTDTSEFSKAIRLNTGIVLIGCTLVIQGTEAVDRVTVARTGNEIRTTASFDPLGVTRVFDASLVDTIELTARGGNDSIQVDFAFPTSLVPSLSCANRTRIALDAGQGNDGATIVLSSPQSTAATVNVQVEAGPGNDSVRFQVHDMVLNDSSFDAFGDDGDDMLDTVFERVVMDRFSQKVLGGLGKEDISVDWRNVAVQSASNSAGADLLVYGDADADTIDVRLSNLLLSRGVLTLQVEGGTGSDIIGVTAQLQTSSVGTFSGQVLGQDGDDKLLFNLFGPGSVLLVPFSVLDGGAGFDTARATPNVVVKNCEA
jgi:CSLREA domain-containing protein